jgi:signal transduction histidine kinase
MDTQGRHWRTDGAIAAAVIAIQVLGTYATSSWHAGHAGPPGRHLAVGVIGYLLLAVGGLALLWRRRYPVAVLAVTLSIELAAGRYDISFANLALIVAFFSAVFARKRAAAVASLVIGYLGSILPGVVAGSPGRPSLAFAFGLLAWLLVLLSAAELIRARRQSAVELRQARQDELRRRAMAERMAIARDLHDVVAHNISVINVQANTALHLMDRQPERAREALTAIHDVSKQALAELRSVLGVLRAGEPDPPRTPGPGIDQIADLADRARSAGLAVRVTRSGEPRAVPADVSVAAYRIVQEALTNSARHAAGSAATVRIGYSGEALRVEVEDDGPVAAPAQDAKPQAGDGSGNGITGMTERAQALGGTLKAGPRPAGGYRVRATLPLAASLEGARR